MAAGLPIEKLFVVVLMAGQSVFSPVQQATPVLSAQEALSSLEHFTPVVGLTQEMTEQIRSELAQRRSA